MSVKAAVVTSAAAVVRDARIDKGVSRSADLEQETAEWRQREPQRVEEAVRRNRLGAESPAIAHIAAAIDRGVAVHQFPVEAGSRHADPVAVTRDRSEVEHQHDEVP